METRFTRRLFFMLGVFMMTCCMLSCKKDEHTDTDKVALLSFGPAGVKHGEKISLIGTHLDRVTAVEFAGASVDKAAFEQHTSELIVLTVPMEAERGQITLKTSEGDIVSKSSFDLEVPVVITSFTANVRPGENLTIKGEFLNWVTGVHFAKDTLVSEFVSQSMTELVVKVPMTAETGPIVIMTSGTQPLIIENERDLVVSLPAITRMSPVPVEREAALTITGTDLDLTEGILFPGIKDPVMQFESKSASQIVVKVPKEANKGKISLKAYSGVLVESPIAMELAGDLPPLEALGHPFFDDELKNGWSKWGGWGSGTAVDMASSEKVRDGEKSIKVTFGGGWGGALQMGGGSATADFTEFRFSVFGTTGTNGKKLNVIVKGGTKQDQVISIVEGEWTEYKWSIASDLGAPATITEFILQDQDWSGTIYIDHIGLK
ncbi:MAG: hypothetical protein ACO1NU_05400 [Arcticibacter sp.]